MASKARKPQAAKNGPKKAHPCNQCEASYDRAGKLKNHIDVIHLGLKPYKCTQCDEAFRQNGHLNMPLCSWGANMSKKIAEASSVDFHT